MRSLPVVLLAFLVADNRQLVTELFISMTAMTKRTWRRCSSQDVVSCSSCHFLPLSCNHLSRPRCCWPSELFVTLCWQPKHKHSQLHINRANTRYLRNRMSKDSTSDPMTSRAVSAWRHLSRRIQALRFVVAVEPYLFINSAINTRQIAGVHQNKLSYRFFFFFFLFLFYCWQRGALLYFRQVSGSWAFRASNERTPASEPWRFNLLRRRLMGKDNFVDNILNTSSSRCLLHVHWTRKKASASSDIERLWMTTNYCDGNSSYLLLH